MALRVAFRGGRTVVGGVVRSVEGWGWGWRKGFIFIILL
jgi:hypothetical protein